MPSRKTSRFDVKRFSSVGGASGSMIFVSYYWQLVGMLGLDFRVTSVFFTRATSIRRIHFRVLSEIRPLRGVIQ